MTRSKRSPAVILLTVFSLAVTLSPAWGNEDVDVHVFAPRSEDVAGLGGRGFFVDLVVSFKDTTLAETGAQLELTGPAPLANAGPFPGAFAAGKNDKFPGLIVLLSTTTIGAGPGQNLAGLFNLTGVTDRRHNDVDIWTTWIVGAAGFGASPANPGPVESILLVAIAGDLNGNGIFDDAPAVIPDLNGDGVINAKDLKQLGVASNIQKVKFFINGQT